MFSFFERKALDGRREFVGMESTKHCVYCGKEAEFRRVVSGIKCTYCGRVQTWYFLNEWGFYNENINNSKGF